MLKSLGGQDSTWVIFFDAGQHQPQDSDCYQGKFLNDYQHIRIPPHLFQRIAIALGLSTISVAACGCRTDVPELVK
jgi:hypothetical protein